MLPLSKKETFTAYCITDIVCREVGYDPKHVLSRSNSHPLPIARHMIAYLLRNEGWTLKRIGQYLDRDHSSVWDGLDSLNNLIDTNHEYGIMAERLAEYYSEYGQGATWANAPPAQEIYITVNAQPTT